MPEQDYAGQDLEGQERRVEAPGTTRGRDGGDGQQRGTEQEHEDEVAVVAGTADP